MGGNLVLLTQHARARLRLTYTSISLGNAILSIAASTGTTRWRRYEEAQHIVVALFRKGLFSFSQTADGRRVS